MSGFRVEEGVGLGGLCDAAGDKQFGQHLGQAGLFGECFGRFRCSSE